jgi:hypothetical protein
VNRIEIRSQTYYYLPPLLLLDLLLYQLPESILSFVHAAFGVLKRKERLVSKPLVISKKIKLFAP